MQSFVVKPYLIPSTSMANTLVPGQRVLVDRLVYRYRAPRAATSSSFAAPSRPTTCSSSAWSGLPGDLLSAARRRLYINGVRAPDSFVDKIDGVTEPTDPADPYASTHPEAPWSLAQPFRVPAGHYFVMGDNRTDSSRQPVLGHRAAQPIIGRAFFTYWPLGRMGDL